MKEACMRVSLPECYNSEACNPIFVQKSVAKKIFFKSVRKNKLLGLRTFQRQDIVDTSAVP